MDNISKTQLIEMLVSNLDKLVPEYFIDPLDRNIANGNVAVCIHDTDGNVYGKIWGTDKIKGRQIYKIAWTKSSQVWITGYKTGEFEKKVYAGEINEENFGLSRPDLIGWEGGQPIKLNGNIDLFVGFSGYRGITDIEIVKRAIIDLV